MPIFGGTDVMVDLNFDRERPGAVLDLTRSWAFLLGGAIAATAAFWLRET